MANVFKILILCLISVSTTYADITKVFKNVLSAISNSKFDQTSTPGFLTLRGYKAPAHHELHIYRTAADAYTVSLRQMDDLLVMAKCEITFIANQQSEALMFNDTYTCYIGKEVHTYQSPVITVALKRKEGEKIFGWNKQIAVAPKQDLHPETLETSGLTNLLMAEGVEAFLAKVSVLANKNVQSNSIHKSS